MVRRSLLCWRNLHSLFYCVAGALSPNNTSCLCFSLWGTSQSYSVSYVPIMLWLVPITVVQSVGNPAPDTHTRRRDDDDASVILAWYRTNSRTCECSRAELQPDTNTTYNAPKCEGVLQWNLYFTHERVHWSHSGEWRSTRNYYVWSMLVLQTMSDPSSTADSAVDINSAWPSQLKALFAL